MDDVAIRINHVSKIFKLPHEKSTSIKGALINKIRGGNHGYEMQHALKDVSFEVKEGDFFGIVGRNGSGKSTLLKMLAGIYAPTKGDIQINGRLTPFIELGVGFNPELTGRENVFLNGALMGFNRKEMAVMYKDIVDFAELHRFMDQKLKNYSSGMQVRLAFSIAIRAQSDILLLDEVLAVGDASFQTKCYNYFAQLKKDKKTVVLVSHDMDAIRRFCNKAALVTNGILTFVGDPAQVTELYLEQNKQTYGSRQDTTTIIDTGVKISKLVIENPKTSYGIKDKIKISMVVEGDKAKEVKVGLQIVKDSGEMIAGVASDSLGFQKLTPGQTLKYTYSFPSAQLTEGRFLVEGAVYEAEHSMPIYYKTAMAAFTTKEQRGWGLINLQGTWTKG